MKKTTINIQHEANIQAKGIHTHKNNKSVICLETGEVWVSVLDTAKDIGCHPSNLILHLQGKQRHCKGKHYCYLSRVNESLDAIVTRLRETSAMEEKARAYDAIMAEQEAIRKAEEERIEAERKAEEKRLEEERKAREKREREIAKADAKVERCQTIRDRIAVQLAEAERNLMTAQMEREALDDEEEEVA
jgi:septal ring factor EnvC (AmiA/AmiB activator)